MPYYFIFLTLISLPAFSKDIKIKGYIYSTIELERYGNGGIYHGGKFNLKTKRYEGVQGRLGLKITTEDNATNIQNLTINKKLDKSARVIWGYQKKKLGFEYVDSKRERASIRRTMIYDVLESSGYTGRQGGVTYEVKPEDDGMGYWFTGGGSESQNSDLLMGTKTISGNFEYYSWLLAQSHHTSEGALGAGVAGLGIRSSGVEPSFESEVFYGLDTDQSELEDTNVFFVAGKLTYFLPRFGESARFLPVVKLAVLNHDTRFSDYQSRSALLGLSFEDGPLLIGANLEYIGRSNKNSTEWSDHDSRGLVEALFSF